MGVPVPCHERMEGFVVPLSPVTQKEGSQRQTAHIKQKHRHRRLCKHRQKM